MQNTPEMTSFFFPRPSPPPPSIGKPCSCNTSIIKTQWKSGYIKTWPEPLHVNVICLKWSRRRKKKNIRGVINNSRMKLLWNLKWQSSTFPLQTPSAKLDFEIYTNARFITPTGFILPMCFAFYLISVSMATRTTKWLFWCLQLFIFFPSSLHKQKSYFQLMNWWNWMPQDSCLWTLTPSDPWPLLVRAFWL